jgi:hypothetical protein
MPCRDAVCLCRARAAAVSPIVIPILSYAEGEGSAFAASCRSLALLGMTKPEGRLFYAEEAQEENFLRG